MRELLVWNVYDLQRLSTCGGAIRTEIATLIDVLEHVAADLIALNVARKIALVQKQMLEFVKGEGCNCDALANPPHTVHFFWVVQTQENSSHSHSRYYGEH